jgi:prepilin-type processing-associated H-X9-DG protein
MKGTLAFLLILFVSLAVVLGFITRLPGETLLHLLIGWASFTEGACRRVTVNWYGVATAGVCVVFLLLGGHPFAAWLITSICSAKPSNATNAVSESTTAPVLAPIGWSWKRTAQLLTVFMLLFMAGTAFVGLVHQIAWLATAPEPLTRYRLSQGRFQYRRAPVDPFIGGGFSNYLDVYGQCPSNGEAPEENQGSHSWQTRILPFMVYNATIDLSLDWDDAKNAPQFRRFVPAYLNPDIGVLRESRGYAVSHYAGNRRLFVRPRRMTAESLKQGFANTILCGEVVSDFMAWGDPGNLRDPSDGVNKTRHGFGSTNERGANFLMLDGSVRFLSNDTAPDVLNVLATPEGD